jgi:thioesterase domain-containing protein
MGDAGLRLRLARSRSSRVRTVKADHDLPGGAPNADLRSVTTEARVGGFVAELLGTEGVAPEIDIFDVGFHSLLALRLRDRINSAFGSDFPVRFIFDERTVGGIARRVDAWPNSAGDLSPQGATFTVNPDGTNAPLFYLHSDLFADGVYCRNLAAAIGSAQPLHALAPHGTYDLPLLPTIEAMARDYVPRIRAIQPQGPYRLGGFCVSGLIAYEVARLLSAEGQVVDDVVLINAAALPTRAIAPMDGIVRTIGRNPRLSPRLRERLCYNVARLHGDLLDGPRGAASFLRGRVLQWIRRGRRRPTTLDANPSPFEKRSGNRETENSFAHLVAALTYHPKPYGGRVTLIWSVDQAESWNDAAAGWQQVAREVRVVPMTGGHVSPLQDGLPELSKILAKVLSEDASPQP